jgi:hypothetical protein
VKDFVGLRTNVSKLEEILEADLANALDLIQSYQRALYTLNSPDPNRLRALDLLNKYGVKAYKKSDGYKIVVETKDGEHIDISKDPEGALVDEDARPIPLAINYKTGEAYVGDYQFESAVAKCPECRVPLNAKNECHRCGYVAE